MSSPFPSALLVLADGTVFQGQGIGAAGSTAGELVFNTAMTGYQEILTDPSYCRQIVTLTYPHIGNTGVNREDQESGEVYAAGLVIRDLPLRVSNWRSEQNLSDFLKVNKVVAIAGIDTRKLTRILREKGAQSGCVVSGDYSLDRACATDDRACATDDRACATDDRARATDDRTRATDDRTRAMDVDKALAEARAFPGLAGMDLAKVVSARAPYEWNEGAWELGKGYRKADSHRFHVAAYDYGVKRNILRLLSDRGCKVTVFPAQTPAKDVLAARPDGVFLSNGPGDPEPCDYAIEAIREVIAGGVPTFGICLGHQLMGLASGAKTLKMKFGHHGANHPVKDLQTGKVVITSQNHGFAVDAATLPATLRPTHVSLFDGSVQGLSRTDKPAFCFQGHPEASPGTHDIGYLFDRFATLMQERK